jgi:hypothetical protein
MASRAPTAKWKRRRGRREPEVGIRARIIAAGILKRDEREAMAKESTVQLDIRLSLPDSVAREAEAGGLLEPESMASLLREAVRKLRVDRFFEAADRLAVLPDPPMTEAEVEAEVQAVRSKRRTRHAGGR